MNERVRVDHSEAFGYDAAVLSRARQRFERTVMGVVFGVAVTLGVVVAVLSPDSALHEAVLPAAAGVGISFVAFVLGVSIAQVLRRRVRVERRVLSDPLILTAAVYSGLLAVALLIPDTVAALVSAIIGVVASTPAFMSMASAHVTTVQRGGAAAELVVEEARAHPDWATLLGGRVGGIAVGVIADMVVRASVLALAWVEPWWILPLFALEALALVVSSRGVARRVRSQWIAPSVTLAALTLALAIGSVLAAAP